MTKTTTRQNPADQTPLDMCYHWEKLRANKSFLTQPIGDGQVREYTWASSMDEARRIAAYLQAQGYPKGARIAIMSKNCAHWVMADIAIMIAGYVSVPLYPTLTAESVRQIMEHSEADAIFVGKLDAWDNMLNGVPESVLKIAFPLAPDNDFANWDYIVASTEPLRGEPRRSPEELATIIYTSGTTGMPKGVMQSFASMAAAAEGNAQLTGSTAEDRMLSYLPLSHVAERAGLEMPAFYSGFQLFFTESLDTFVDDLRRARPTIFFSVPRLWMKFQQGVSSKMPEAKLRRLLRLPIIGRMVRRKVLTQLGLESVRRAGTGAAPLPEAIMNWYRDLGLELLEVYGMTETFGVSHAGRPGEVRIGYVGQVVDGVDSKLSEAGEILVRGPSNTMGYYKEPEKTAELFTEDGYIRTGDRGDIDDKGRYRITGRTKEIFKTSKGKYVAPAPIENKLSAHPDVEACCVMGESQAQACALVMLSEEALERNATAAAREETLKSLERLLLEVNGELDAHEQLAFLVVVDEQWEVENGFLTPSMKIKRAVIESHYGNNLDAWYGRRRPVIW